MSEEMRVRLYCEDCQVALKELRAKSVDLIITDPPYGISYRSNRQIIDRKRSFEREGNFVVREHYFNTIDNDNNLPTDWLVEAYRVLKDDAAIYIFAHWSKWGELQSAAQVAGFTVKNMIVLHKSNHGMGSTTLQYAPKHELVLFASKGTHILLNPDGRKSDIWNVPVKFSGSHKFHPNEKPASWIQYAIINSSLEDQVILDPFMGSGSFGIASIKSKRQFIGMESNVQYFDIAKARIDAAINETDVNLF